MNTFFIILLLKTDPELQNEDIMVREVERIYISTFPLLASKQPIFGDICS